ncbi:MAG: DNA-3-methyladenine glycosylase 2 family protein [Acidobacteria bacterium]|nr:DNA-3-methyladenine glycosylase 2 family protein [Acidobacteriota bacterium]
MSFSAAVRHLKKSDSVMRALIEKHGPCKLKREYETEPFASLVDAIIYQQISYAAAGSIARRFRALYGENGDAGHLPKPEELLKTHPRTLRAVGLSRQKSAYMRDLAGKAADGSLRLDQYHKMPDEAVVENVTQVKGIGRWTAEMFLMFCLGRMDVLPVGDLGVQYGFKMAYKLRKMPSAEKMEKIAEPWRPYRSVATWYLWQIRREELVKAKLKTKKR